MRRDRRRRTPNNNYLLYDISNIVLGISIIISSIVLFIDIKSNERLFAIVFTLSGTMNLVMGIKYFARREIGKTIGLFLASVVLYIIAAISFIALW